MSDYIIGCLLAILSAFFWAWGAILFKDIGEDVSPAGINIAKSAVATICLGGSLLFMKPVPMSEYAYVCLGISGLLGITLGDTLFLRSLVDLGPRLSLTITLLIPGVTVLLSLVFLQEQLSLGMFLGIIFALLGIYLVLEERTPSANDQVHKLSRGIQYGILSVISCSVSIIVSKMVLESTSTIKAAFIRQFWGGVGLILGGMFRSKLGAWVKPFAAPVLLKKMIFAAFISTFLGAWCSLAALKYTYASIATLLNATSPLFILPLSFFMLKEKITSRAVVGALIAFVGVSIILFER